MYVRSISLSYSCWKLIVNKTFYNVESNPRFRNVNKLLADLTYIAKVHQVKVICWFTLYIDKVTKLYVKSAWICLVARCYVNAKIFIIEDYFKKDVQCTSSFHWSSTALEESCTFSARHDKNLPWSDSSGIKITVVVDTFPSGLTWNC